MSAAEVLCPHCDTPSRDGGLCDRCEETLAYLLGQAPGVIAQLIVQITRQAVGVRGHGKAAEPPMPINVKAAEIAARYKTVLIGWGIACGGEGNPTLDGDGRQAARWLHARIYELRIHPAATDILDEILECHTACIRAIDRYGTDIIYIGNCGALLPPNDIECQTVLKVRKDKTTAVCHRCEARYDVAEMLAARDAIVGQHIMSTAEIAKLNWRTADYRLIGPRLIQSLVQSGALTPVGERENPGKQKPAQLYRLADVKNAANGLNRFVTVGSTVPERQTA